MKRGLKALYKRIEESFIGYCPREAGVLTRAQRRRLGCAECRGCDGASVFVSSTVAGYCWRRLLFSRDFDRKIFRRKVLKHCGEWCKQPENILTAEATYELFAETGTCRLTFSKQWAMFLDYFGIR